jgi:hypothetical protein
MKEHVQLVISGVYGAEKSEKQIPRRLKSARDDKDKGARAGSEVVP